MLISRSCLDAVGLFDEAAFAIAYNDVDYCMRARACGYRVVWTPFARLVHHESVSRGRDEGHDRFEREKATLKARHATADFQDPAFSPWFSRNHPQPGLVLPDCLPESR
jgi:GT2 family glycosyltransferase